MPLRGKQIVVGWTGWGGGGPRWKGLLYISTILQALHIYYIIKSMWEPSRQLLPIPLPFIAEDTEVQRGRVTCQGHTASK